MKEILFSRRKKDFRIDWFSGSGAGGQHRNKHQNCCRITDIQTGLVGISQDSRSRQENQKKAFHRLVDKLVEHYKVHKPRQRRNTDNQAVTRTYHMPDNRVTDHLTNTKYSFGDTVGKDDMTELIEGRIRWMNKEQTTT